MSSDTPESLVADASAAELSESDWAGIRSAHEAENYRIQTVPDGFRAGNPSQGFRSEFDGRGFTVTPASGDWSWGLELQSYGFEGSLAAIQESATATAEGDRVSYAWSSSLEEWFVNDKRGVEHGYTVRERPARGDRDLRGPLLFYLGIRGGLNAVPTTDARGVNFLKAEGSTAVSYTGLLVLDADGRELWASLSKSESGLLLSVDESSASYPITIDPLVHQTYFKASNAGFEDHFGCAVSISGTTAVVGAYNEQSAATGVNGDQGDNSQHSSGAAYVFVRNGSTWTQEAYLKSSNAEYSDQFGWSVSISGDTIAVGAHRERSAANGIGGDQTDNTADAAGAVYVFTRTGKDWTQEAYVKASNSDAWDHFGTSVSVDGDTLVVGAMHEESHATGVNGDQSSNFSDSSGAAYVFLRTGTTWAQQAYLKASIVDPDDNFGENVAISGDTLVVTAPGEDSFSTGVNSYQPDNSAQDSGAAYIFIRSGTGWSEDAYLKASNTRTDDNFGSSVAIEGDLVVVGASQEDCSSTGVDGNQFAFTMSNAGAAYVYERNGATWGQTAYLKASNTGTSDAFGGSVALSGNRLLVGAIREDSDATGVDGNQAGYGAPNSGAAYLFDRSGASWVQGAYYKASNSGTGDSFGRSVAISGITSIIGAFWEGSKSTGIDGDQADNSSNATGAAYGFDIGIFHDCNGNGLPDEQDISSGLSADCDGNGNPDECDVTDPYLDIDGDGQLDSCFPAPLMADVYELSVAAGGVQTFALNAPYALDVYFVFGTASGTSPGLSSGGFHIPLNLDSYLAHTASHPNSAPLQGSYGILTPAFPGPGGQGAATFSLPPAFSSSLVGLTLHHAFVAVDLLSASLSFVSNPVPVALLP